MLEELSVRDFALIDRLQVSFSQGFTVLSGETGAGKSLLIGAIGFLLGARADTGVIRAGAEEAAVTGLFEISGNGEALEWLRERGLEPEDGRVFLRRGIKASGRGAAFIQERPVLRSDLQGFTALLVDLHGQHEHQALLSPENHRRILDRYAGLEGTLAAYAAAFEELLAARKARDEALAAGKDRERELEFLSFAVEELGKAKLRRGEEEELQAEERLLSQHERLYSAVDLAHGALVEASGESGGGLAALRKARQGLEAAAGIDPSLVELSARLTSAYYELEDVGDSLRSYLGSMRYSPERLEEIEARLAELGRLRRKYGADPEALIERLDRDRERLAAIESWEENLEEAERRAAELEAAVYERALGISEARRAAAGRLAEGIGARLAALGMPRSRFIVSCERKGQREGKPLVGPWGIDEVEFVIAPNPGEPPRPLARIASGGELSRVALAAKAVLAESDPVGTLIFDEVDTGVGGEVAVSVGEALAGLGRGRQVLCITHLASIAARADTHYRVEKDSVGDRTAARVARVEGRARAEEIARMLAGDPEGEASLAHAVELLRKHGNWRGD